MASAGALGSGSRPADGAPAREIRFRNLTFAYPDSPPVLEGFDLTIPAGTSLAIVGQNGAGKTTLAKLICRFYDPQAGAIEIDGADLREFEISGWRRSIAAVFQDFARFDLSLRDNVAPRGASDDAVRAALAAPARPTSPRSTRFSRAATRAARISRADSGSGLRSPAPLAAVAAGAGLVLLRRADRSARRAGRGGDLPAPAEGLAERATTILISHRFSTVRHADRICVLERGRMSSLGSHDELMALGGRYRTMFDLQASRFTSGQDEEGRDYERLA